MTFIWGNTRLTSGKREVKDKGKLLFYLKTDYIRRKISTKSEVLMKVMILSLDPRNYTLHSK